MRRPYILYFKRFQNLARSRHALAIEDDSTVFFNTNDGAFYDFGDKQILLGIVSFGSFATFVDEERKRVVLFFCECSMRFCIGRIDAKDADSGFLEFAPVIANGAELYCTARCLVARIEDEDDWACG